MWHVHASPQWWERARSKGSRRLVEVRFNHETLGANMFFLMGWKKVMQSRACGIWSVYPLWNWVWSPATPNIMLAVSSRFFPNGCCLLGCPYNLSRHWVSIKISDQNVYRYVITLNGQFFWCNYLFLMVAELYSGTTGDAISMPWCIHNRYTTWVFIEWAKPFFGAMSIVFEGTMRGDFGFISF